MLIEQVNRMMQNNSLLKSFWPYFWSYISLFSFICAYCLEDIIFNVKIKALQGYLLFMFYGWSLDPVFDGILSLWNLQRITSLQNQKTRRKKAKKICILFRSSILKSMPINCTMCLLLFGRYSRKEFYFVRWKTFDLQWIWNKVKCLEFSRRTIF